MKYNSPTKVMQHQLAAMRTRLLKSVEFKWVGSYYCWLWTIGRGKDGYGLIKVSGKTRRVHRVSYEAFRGPIPRGLIVCHTCDQPLCINPNHLFLGTDQDNTNDKRAKGRHPTKLSESEVIAIRDARARGVLQRELTERYGVCAAQITRIQQRKQWAHI